jgi:predicted DNA-binding transcriptional regulator YafY
MRSGRLLSILILLQLRVRLTAEALAEEFGVSVRTIYRDIDELSASGVPVQADRGPGGGFALAAGYRTRLTGLQADEAQALLMIGMPGPAAALGLGPAAKRARGKVLASMPPAFRDAAGRVGARFHLDPVDWYREPDPVGHLPALTRAVLEQRRIDMSYESWTTVRDWRIDPLGLVLKGGRWYLVGRGAGKERIFNVATIRTMTVTDTTFDRPVDFDLPAFWQAEIARFEAGLRPMTAVVRATAVGRRRLSELGAWAARAVSAAEPDAPIRLPVESVERGALVLLGIGPEVEIVEPPELRRRVRELATAVAAKSSRVRSTT